MRGTIKNPSFQYIVARGVVHIIAGISDITTEFGKKRIAGGIICLD
jgi:hypothetical protein